MTFKPNFKIQAATLNFEEPSPDRLLTGCQNLFKSESSQVKCCSSFLLPGSVHIFMAEQKFYAWKVNATWPALNQFMSAAQNKT